MSPQIKHTIFGTQCLDPRNTALLSSSHSLAATIVSFSIGTFQICQLVIGYLLTNSFSKDFHNYLYAGMSNEVLPPPGYTDFNGNYWPTLPSMQSLKHLSPEESGELSTQSDKKISLRNRDVRMVSLVISCLLSTPIQTQQGCISYMFGLLNRFEATNNLDLKFNSTMMLQEKWTIQEPYNYKVKEAKIAKIDSYSHSVLYKYNNETCRNRRSLICDFPGCGMKFSKSWNLLDHARTHTGERPYACSLCDMKFTQKGNLNKHMKVHTPFSVDERKIYQCEYCDKSYTERFNLNVSGCYISWR